MLWNKVFDETQRQHCIENLGGALSGAKRPIQEGFLKLIFKIDPDYGTRLAKHVGVPMGTAKL
jgi:catalase